MYEDFILDSAFFLSVSHMQRSLLIASVMKTVATHLQSQQRSNPNQRGRCFFLSSCWSLFTVVKQRRGRSSIRWTRLTWKFTSNFLPPAQASIFILTVFIIIFDTLFIIMTVINMVILMVVNTSRPAERVLQPPPSLLWGHHLCWWPVWDSSQWWETRGIKLSIA